METPFRLASPLFLLLFPLVFFFLYLSYQNRIGQEPFLRFSSLSLLEGTSGSRRELRKGFLVSLRALVLFLMLLALLRPQKGEGLEELRGEGIDLMLALDVSGSMKALDFLPRNRLEGAKLAAKEFIKKRTSDRIGLVVFGGQSYTQAPLTLDHEQLATLLDQVHIGIVEDGTAIGLAISSCVNRLKTSETKGKVIILFTDGINNAGEIDPLAAAQLAKYFGVKVYTIGAGKTGFSLYPAEEGETDELLSEPKYVRVRNELDENQLRAIAAVTGGRYFRVEDTLSLEKTFQEIDRLERVGVTSRRYKQVVELFPYLLWPAVVLLVLDIVLRNTLFLKIP